LLSYIYKSPLKRAESERITTFKKGDKDMSDKNVS
jgi:hypothetical protein